MQKLYYTKVEEAYKPEKRSRSICCFERFGVVARSKQHLTTQLIRI